MPKLMKSEDKQEPAGDQFACISTIPFEQDEDFDCAQDDRSDTHSLQSTYTLNIGPDDSCPARSKSARFSSVVQATFLPGKSSDSITSVAKQFAKSIHGPMLCCICGTFTSFVAWLVLHDTRVSMPAWLLLGCFVSLGVLVIQIIQSAVVYQINMFGLGGCLLRVMKKVRCFKSKVQTPQNNSVFWSSSGSLESNTSSKGLVSLAAQSPRPELEQGSLICQGEDKDWFRLLQRAATDNLSSTDLAGCSLQQIQLLMPPLVLSSSFGFAQKQLGKWLVDCNSLAIRAVCLVMSEKQEFDFLESTVNKERVDRWNSYVKFYESCCQQQGLPKILEGDQLPAGLQSPFTGSSASIEMLVLENRFSSGHGPVVISLKYRTCHTVEQHNLCKGDFVEAFSDGDWRRGTIMGVSTAAFDFRDATGKEHFNIVPENVRPWPSRLLLKPDTIANDATCFSMFRVFNYLWHHSFIPEVFKPYALDLEAVPAGPKFGFMEYAENSQPAAKYDWDKLYSCDETQLQVFLRSAAGSMIAGHVLGIGDRHEDNIMLREVDMPEVGACIQFFQVDFKHCFGIRSRIDTNPITMPRKMKEVLENIKLKTNLWQDLGDQKAGSSTSPANGVQNAFDELVAMCGMAFRVLRRNSGIVMHLARLLNRDAELAEVWESHFMDSLCFAMKEEDAAAHICKKVRCSAGTLAKLVKDVSHKASCTLAVLSMGRQVS